MLVSHSKYKLIIVILFVSASLIKIALNDFSENPKTIDLRFEEVMSMDLVVYNDKIHLLAAGKIKQQDSLITVKHSSSENLGVQWSNEVELKNAISPISSFGNDIQLATFENNLLAIWQIKGELPGMGPLISYLSKDNGKTWTKQSNPAADDLGDQSHVDIIADKSGNFHAVWLADPEENGYQSLRYSRFKDEQWQASERLDDSTCSCCWNTIALSATGDLSILYRDMKPRDMVLISSQDQGLTWSNKSIVGDFKWQFDGCPHLGGGLAESNKGDIYSTVWTGLENHSGLYTLKSSDNGKSWTEPVLLSQRASHSGIAVNSKQVVAVWDQRDDDGNAVYFVKSTDDGKTWSNPIRISSGKTNATFPHIVAQEQGFLVVWTEKSSGKPAQLISKPLH
ncbi:MAG: sialidase family protein [Methylococcales bacterium]|nr:sialidase family protein [Methylococcales bacterium]